MSTVVFYEKPGCGNNTKQKMWLAASGHTVLAKNLLTEKWNPERLRSFFGDLPVAQWFNPSAPRIKSGEIDPSTIDATTALNMMLAEPLFIRRPLMDVDGVLRTGFDAKAVDAWIGLNDSQPKEEACPICHRSDPCPTPEAPSPRSSGETTSHSTKHDEAVQVAGYPASGESEARGAQPGKRKQPCSTLESSHA